MENFNTDSTAADLRRSARSLILSALDAEYNRQQLKSYSKSMLLRPEFREAIFPFLLSFLALVLVIIRIIYENNK